MKIKFLRSYRSKAGNTTFVYTVDGTKEQLEEFKAVQGEFFREAEDGKALWFTTRFCGDNASLVLAGKDEKKRYVPDMSDYEKAASLAKQFNGDLGKELASQAAAKLLGHKHEASVPADGVPSEPPF